MGDGYNESFNGKLRDELLNGEIFYTLKEAQELIEQWRNRYNTIRPHSSLGYPFPFWPAITTRPSYGVDPSRTAVGSDDPSSGSCCPGC